MDGRSIARCLKSYNFANVFSCTLHHFSDECEGEYGQSSYIGLLNGSGKTHCTTPRLELTAASLSVKISKMLKTEMDIHVDDEIFWNDDNAILGYINRMFVGSRFFLKIGSSR